MEHLILVLVIGLIAGWLAGLIMKGRGFGVVGDIVVGVVGAVVGSWSFNTLGLSAYGLLGVRILAVLGAVVFLGLVSLIKRA